MVVMNRGFFCQKVWKEIFFRFLRRLEERKKICVKLIKTTIKLSTPFVFISMGEYRPQPHLCLAF